ncbi:hypothetical protein HMPREF1557_00542 [Streptococcus sobrinus W1703]|uniref:Uncharacterized protein n=1 Tax=Streptococcus sobrinus W1703 TaxID=1227275 RepID=U2JDH2_9STRE|nr:hypothetical protein HMPREF1557_00542 [Streptococcus sobrinus W1703]
MKTIIKWLDPSGVHFLIQRVETEDGGRLFEVQNFQLTALAWSYLAPK